MPENVTGEQIDHEQTGQAARMPSSNAGPQHLVLKKRISRRSSDELEKTKNRLISEHQYLLVFSSDPLSESANAMP